MFLLAVVRGYGACGNLELAEQIQEMRQARDAMRPASNFEDDFEVAEGYLNAEDELDVDKGIRFFNRLKKNYPNSEKQDRIAWRLARHFRDREAHLFAVKQFENISHETVGS